MAYAALGRRIRLRRQALGLTQEELAAKVGVARGTVSAWERGLSPPTRNEGALWPALGADLTDPEEPAPEPWKQALLDLHNLPPGLDAADLIEIVDGVLRRQERNAG